jgi:GH43 family beta-xylosidase
MLLRRKWTASALLPMLLIAALAVSARLAEGADEGNRDAGAARAASPAPAPEPIPTSTFFNVLLPDGADPWVIRSKDGRYLSLVTTGSNVVLRRSTSLSAMGSGERRVIWQPEPGSPYGRDLWAPELHRLEGKWYVYVAADDGENANHRMVVLENPEEDPFEGTFAFKGKIADLAEDRWAIDGTVFQAGGQTYFLWSGWEGTENTRQCLYLAPMKNPWTLAGPRVRISCPTLDWEMRGAPPAINEGPQAIVRDDRVMIVYSASGSWTNHYCLGLLSATVGHDLLSPASWTKHAQPIFQSGNSVIAPGHCSFTTSPDGHEDWIVYHAARFPGAGWTRSVRAQPFHWNADGSPALGEPVDPDRPISVPSGEPLRLRIEAESAALQEPAHSVSQANASGGARVSGIRGEAHITFALNVDEAGSYAIVVRFGSGGDGRSEASHRLTVNGEEAGTIRYPSSGRGQWSNAYTRVSLAAGANQIVLSPREGSAEVDCLDVILKPISASSDR